MKFEIPVGLSFEYAKKLSKKFSDDEILKHFDVYFHHNGYRINVKDLIGILTLGIVRKSVVKIEIRRKPTDEVGHSITRNAASNPDCKFKKVATKKFKCPPKYKSIGSPYVIRTIKNIFREQKKS